MAAQAQVTWATTTGASSADVQMLGGVVKRLFGKSNWKLKPEDAIASIEHDEWRFFVELDEEKVWLEVDETADGLKKLSLPGDADAGEIFSALPDKPAN